MKKILALLLAVMMVASLLAGCGGSGSAPADTGSNTPADTGSAPADTGSAPADTGSTPADTGSTGEIPTIKWFMVGGGMPSNYDAWKAKVDAYLEEKIGVHLDIECVTWGDWGQRRTVVVQTNEPYDLMFTDMGSYVNDVNSGAFADLTDLIKETPGLTEAIPALYLQACELDGHLYAIPAYKDNSMTNFFVWTKDRVEQSFPGYADAHTLADITEGLRQMKEDFGEPPFLLNKDGISCVVGNKYDNMGIGLWTLGISYRAGDNKIVSIFEQEDVLADLRTMHEWMGEGLINSDAAVLNEASGLCGVGVSQGWPAAAKGWGESRGADVVVSQFEDTVLSTETVRGSMTCVSASSAHQLEALKLLELVNTDYWLRDALYYGEEGVNFEYVEENGERRIHKLNTDWTLAGYTQGSFFDLTLEAEADTGIAGNYYIDEVAVQNETALVSPALGFYCDTTSIADKLAACSAIWDAYKPSIITGTADPDEEVAKMMAEMRNAGFDDIQAEVQAQFDAWLASK